MHLWAGRIITLVAQHAGAVVWKRARLHWATARVYRARWYARFWYEDVVEQPPW